MKQTSYNKLVRDNIPTIIKENGEKPLTRTLRKNEYKKELLKKLKEEVNEAITSKDKKSLIEELADIQEVMLALYSAYGIDCKDVTTTARMKRKKRGGFSKRIFLEKVE